jgi:hypothetical protein
MRVLVFGILLFVLGCNQVSGAADFTFKETETDQLDAGYPDAGK